MSAPAASCTFAAFGLSSKCIWRTMATLFVSYALERNTTDFPFRWTLLACHLETSGILPQKVTGRWLFFLLLLLDMLLLSGHQEPVLNPFFQIGETRVFVEGWVGYCRLDTFLCNSLSSRWDLSPGRSGRDGALFLLVEGLPENKQWPNPPRVSYLITHWEGHPLQLFHGRCQEHWGFLFGITLVAIKGKRPHNFINRPCLVSFTHPPPHTYIQLLLPAKAVPSSTTHCIYQTQCSLAIANYRPIVKDKDLPI